MAFNLANENDAAEVWKHIPSDADIVMTHGPAHGILDRIFAGTRVGDRVLRRELEERVQPKFHCCGHIHEVRLIHRRREPHNTVGFTTALRDGMIV